MNSEGDYEILIGTYEEFVLGYQLMKSENEKNKYTLTRTFVTHSHTASVRSVAATSKLAASSGADETVVLYDMIKRKQSGALMQHEGTITCLKFTPEGSHLISCSDDGSIAIFRVGSWQLEKLFKKAHKGTAVNHIAIHPSGKLALSVGKDKTLRTWNLVKGRPAYITNLSSFGVAFDNIDNVVWSPEGNLYAIPIQSKAAVFSVAKGGVIHSLESNCKVHCVHFLDENTVVTGNEESNITCYNLSDGTILWTKKAASSRVKGLSSQAHHLIAITSAGNLLVFDTSDVTKEPDVIASSNDACRFTCLTIRPPVVSENTDTISVPARKRKKKSIQSTDDSTANNITTSSGNEEEVETVNISLGGQKRKKTKDSTKTHVVSSRGKMKTSKVRKKKSVVSFTSYDTGGKPDGKSPKKDKVEKSTKKMLTHKTETVKVTKESANGSFERPKKKPKKVKKKRIIG